MNVCDLGHVVDLPEGPWKKDVRVVDNEVEPVFFTPVKAVSQSAAALTPATPRAVAAAETGARALSAPI